MRILVTGGAGFIGSNFIHYVLKTQADFVVNLDKLTYAGNLASLADVQDYENYVFVQGDINDTQLVTKLVQTYALDTIINFAAESHVDRSIVNPDIFVTTNVLGTVHLLDVAKQNKLQRFLQVSTDEVYGALGANGYFTETSPIQPSSPYSASKAAADQFVLAYHKTYGLPVNVTRCSNNYGPYQNVEKLIPQLIARALKQEKFRIYGTGKNVRDWIYVLDHCRALYMVLKKGQSGEIYNIGGHGEKTNIEIANWIQQAFQQKDLIELVADRPGHDWRYAMDAHKIQQQLGWEKQVSFETGMQRTLTWYLNHRAYLKPSNH
ncbi:MAG: dTDP-glucose 4,6-dehydratase [Lactobacillus sp.]|jgi:dTDP-glucose 4,6-dehydratase|nr:dTDP-glucose 4,6-dehydratase [Lactobacillus sp.]